MIIEGVQDKPQASSPWLRRVKYSSLVAVALLHPGPKFLPLALLPPIVDTAVLVTLAVLIFRVFVRSLSEQTFDGSFIAFSSRLQQLLVDILACGGLRRRALLSWR